MASYSAVIDLRVQGQEGLRAVSDRLETINRLIKQIKPVPTLFDARADAEITAAKQKLGELVKAYADGNTRVAKYSTSLAGLNQQMVNFKTIAANAKVGSDQFTNALKAGEIASRKLADAELERLTALRNVYTRQPTGTLTANEQGSSKMVRDLLSLDKQVPDSIAGLNAFQRELREVQELVSMNSVDFRELEQAIYKVDVALGKVQFGPQEPPVQGPALPANFVPPGRAATGARGGPPPGSLAFNPNAAAENLALGAGFPLLFGGGVGQVSGGLLGSFFGSGFGGQILGSAIGQQLEDAQRRIAEIGTATETLNLDALRDSVVYVNSDLDYTVQQMRALGQAEEARAEIARETTLQTGLVPGAVDSITNNVNLLGNSWNEFLGAVSGTLAIIGAPFVSALTVIAQGLAKALQFINLIGSGTGEWLKGLTEGILKILPGGDKLLAAIQSKTEAITEEEQKRITALRMLTDGQLKELQQSQALFNIESQRTLGRTTAEKQINAELDRQLASQKINAEFAQKAKDLRTEYATVTTEAGQRELELALQLNEGLRQQALNQETIKTQLAEQELQLDRNKNKYDRIGESIQRQIASLERGQAVEQSRVSAEAALNDLYGTQLQRQYELAQTAQQRYNIALQLFDQEIRAAALEYEQAIASNKLLVEKAVLEAQIVESKYRQLEAEQAIAIAQATARGNTAKDIAAIDQAYKVALGLQQQAVEDAYAQVQATAEIAGNQDVVAEALLKTKVIQAEANLAQKLMSDEIGLSANAANNLAGSMAILRQETLLTEEASTQVVGVIETGTQQTVLMAQAMSDVATQASKAAYQINQAVQQQFQLNAARGQGSATPQPKKAAEGAYWPGGFKAFAEGGVVTQPTMGLVGEGGEAEYIIPASKMQAAMERYASGQRGSSVIPTSVNPQVSVTTGPVMNMDGRNYVSQQDFMTGLQTASKRGAEMALQTLGNSYSARRSAGIA